MSWLNGPRRRGAVIVPAYNEAAVIASTLAPLSQAATEGYIELIVVCNGCVDDTADQARSVPGATVVELATASKPLALNTGDQIATLWPRIYLDGDIAISAETVVATLDRLGRGDILAARPSFEYGLEGSRPIVRRYYRARMRMSAYDDALWWAGVYGVSEAGHARFGEFPGVMGDDKFIDSIFESHEKAVVPTEPAVWHTPTTAKGLLTVLTRHHRGNAELAALEPTRIRPTGMATARGILKTIRSPGSCVDASVYLTFALAARWRTRRADTAWARDDTSRIARQAR